MPRHACRMTLLALLFLFQSRLSLCASGTGDFARGVGVAPTGQILSSIGDAHQQTTVPERQVRRQFKADDVGGTGPVQSFDFGVRRQVHKRDVDAARSVLDTATTSMERRASNRTACSASLLRAQAKASVLLLGSSVDRKSLVNYCNHTHGDLQNDEKLVKVIFSQNEPRICTAPNVDVGYLFIPGSGPPPYWGCDRPPHLTCGNHSSDGHVQHARTEDIISLDAVDFATRHFGSAPSLIVVESSLWDLARWWQKDGKNWQEFNKGLDGYITKWCNQEVPNLLEQVQHAFPNSCVAFRTPPTVVGKSIGGSPEAVERMAQCIRSQLKDRYLLIDYHQVVDDLVREGIPLATLLPDGRHPNVDASVRYLDIATGVAAGSISADEIGSHWSNPAEQQLALSQDEPLLGGLIDSDTDI